MATGSKASDARPATPTLEKMTAVHETSQAIGEFLDWLLNTRGVHLLRFDETVDRRVCGRRWPDNRDVERTTVQDLLRLDAELRGTDPETVPELPLPAPPTHPESCACHGTGYIETRMDDWIPVGASIEKLLAEYYDIDLNTAADERDALLDWVRKQNGIT